MSFIDIKYINLISPRLQKFSKKKDYLYNFRCPYCGDSSKNRNRARGFFFRKNANMIYKCHNCGVGRTLSNFLKDNCLDLHDQYIMERFKEGTTGKGTNAPSPEINFVPQNKINKSIFRDCKRITELDSDHPAVKYLQSRNIPSSKLDKLYYVDKFKEWVNGHKQTFEDLTNDEPRIVIPFTDGKVVYGHQGRSLNPKSKLRYITTIIDDTYPKIYNLDEIDWSKAVYITEGPIDSMFVDNCIAMIGADVDYNFLKKHNSKFVFVYDNEPRNLTIVKRMEKVIDLGYNIVIWPKSIQQKDINDMVLSGINVNETLSSNVSSGLQAKVKLTEWKRV